LLVAYSLGMAMCFPPENAKAAPKSGPLMG
jgi:hypothetical protein